MHILHNTASFNIKFQMLQCLQPNKVTETLHCNISRHSSSQVSLKFQFHYVYSDIAHAVHTDSHKRKWYVIHNPDAYRSKSTNCDMFSHLSKANCEFQIHFSQFEIPNTNKQRTKTQQNNNNTHTSYLCHHCNHLILDPTLCHVH